MVDVRVAKNRQQRNVSRRERIDLPAFSYYNAYCPPSTRDPGLTSNPLPKKSLMRAYRWRNRKMAGKQKFRIENNKTSIGLLDRSASFYKRRRDSESSLASCPSNRGTMAESTAKTRRPATSRLIPIFRLIALWFLVCAVRVCNAQGWCQVIVHNSNKSKFRRR